MGVITVRWLNAEVERSTMRGLTEFAGRQSDISAIVVNGNDIQRGSETSETREKRDFFGWLTT